MSGWARRTSPAASSPAGVNAPAGRVCPAPGVHLFDYMGRGDVHVGDAIPLSTRQSTVLFLPISGRVQVSVSLRAISTSIHRPAHPVARSAPAFTLKSRFMLTKTAVFSNLAGDPSIKRWVRLGWSCLSRRIMSSTRRGTTAIRALALPRRCSLPPSGKTPVTQHIDIPHTRSQAHNHSAFDSGELGRGGAFATWETCECGLDSLWYLGRVKPAPRPNICS